MKSGALRESMTVNPESITWGEGLGYAAYQHEGVVYGPNFPIISGGVLSGFFRVGERRYPTFKGGTITGWYSIPEIPKYPTDRELGTPGEWRGWTFGYSTPDTTHHWVDKMLQLERRGMNNQITAYLKREARDRNL
jgi:hypothetical protein